MEQPHSIGDALIVAAITAGIIGYIYIRYLERRRRLETIHAERVMAMEKGIPLPELPLEPATRPNSAQESRQVTLIIGLVLAMFGIGSMITLSLLDEFRWGWPAPLPVAFIGLGLVLFYVLTAEPDRSSPTHRGR
jgi:hypothetical protein